MEEKKRQQAAERYLAQLAAQAGIVSDSLDQVLHARGTRIGAWRLVQQIGRGGMGVVYLAERADDQFAKQVALKMLPLGLVTREAKARFQAEREILARLEHPHIARLLDGGVTGQGTPYYVMEYVNGVCVTQHAHRESSVNRRLDLFSKICDAVAYAHRNLIIHRDIKPANILVGDDGKPKLLDFGIAKLVESERQTTATAFAERRLTPAYAAPEQLRGEVVTTACDVYSLGVVLYELLAGRLPFDQETTGDPGWRERVMTTQPPLPSIRAGDPELARCLRGDLDHIVLRAMHRDPARRYPTVDALIDDLNRYKQRLPVNARPDTWTYRASRFLRRHALAVGTGLSVALALLALTGVALWQSHERDRAARRAIAVKDFLVALFEAANPDETLGEAITVRDLYRQGAARARTALSEAPAVQGELLMVMALAARGMGDHQESLDLATESVRALEKAYGSRSVEVAGALRLQGLGWLDTGDLPGARAALQRAAALHLAHRGPRSEDYNLDLRRLGEVELWAGRPEKAAALFRKALANLPRTEASRSERGIVQGMLAKASVKQGKFEQSEHLFGQALANLTATLGPNHHETLVTRVEYSSTLIKQGQHERAAVQLRDALAGFEAIYGPGHPQLLGVRNNLAVILYMQGDYAGAEAEFRKLVAYWRESDNPEQISALSAQSNLAGALQKQGKLDEAKALYVDVHKRGEKLLGEDHPVVANVQSHLADIALAGGDIQGAAALAGKAYASRRAAFGENNLPLAVSLHQLGVIAAARHRPDDARDYFSRAYEMRQELLGEQHPDTMKSLEALQTINASP